MIKPTGNRVCMLISHLGSLEQLAHFTLPVVGMLTYCSPFLLFLVVSPKTSLYFADLTHSISTN